MREYLFWGAVACLSGLVHILAAVFRWEWLLGGKGLAERLNLAEAPWYRALIAVLGTVWVAAGGYFVGAGLGLW